ncbi:MAG: NfeD family protein [Actinomycetota bacterium]
MRRRFLLLVGSFIVVLWPAVAFGQSTTAGAAPPIDVIKVEGAIDGPLLGFLNDRLDAAVADGAVVVLQLDTSGTLDQNAIELANRVAALPVPVLTWIGPVPARASGAGLLLMYASSLSGVSPGSQTGPLEPLDLLHPDRTAPDLDASVTGWLAGRGHDVDRSLENEALTAQQALDGGFAQVAATSVLDFLDAVDGREVRVPAGTVTLETKIVDTERVAAGEVDTLRFNEPGPVKRLQHAVATPTMVYVLLVIGLACLAFELTQPGFGFAGFAGVGLLILEVYGIVIAPPWWLGLLVLLGSIGLLVADVQLRRFGILTGIGLVTFVAGSFLLYRGVADAIAISPWLIGGMTVASFLYYGFGLTVAIQSRDRIVSTQRGLIGLLGEARGRLAPDGPVYVKGALWRGRSMGEPIDPGSMVRVRGVDGLILQVEDAGSGPSGGPIDEPALPGPSSGD